MATFSTLLWLVEYNIALGHCKEWTEEEIQENGNRSNPGGQKKPDQIARILVNGCAQYAVAERLAEEWNLLGSEIRMKFTDIANSGWRSGNVTKGLLRLDGLLGGKILRRQPLVIERSGRKEKRGQMYVTSPTAWSFVALPTDYASWPPERKKRYQQQLARERREGRGF